MAVIIFLTPATEPELTKIIAVTRPFIKSGVHGLKVNTLASKASSTRRVSLCPMGGTHLNLA
jgi:hypothetical protein